MALDVLIARKTIDNYTYEIRCKSGPTHAYTYPILYVGIAGYWVFNDRGFGSRREMIHYFRYHKLYPFIKETLHHPVTMLFLDVIGIP